MQKLKKKYLKDLNAQPLIDALQSYRLTSDFNLKIKKNFDKNGVPRKRNQLYKDVVFSPNNYTDKANDKIDYIEFNCGTCQYRVPFTFATIIAACNAFSIPAMYYIKVEGV